MRTIATILVFSLSTSLITVFAQTKTRGYQLVFGKDTFQIATTISKDPLDRNSLIEDSHIFKDHSQIIKIPRRIDSITVYNMYGTKKKKPRIDTVDYIVVNKVIDTISKVQLTTIMNSEIKIYDRKVKLKFDEAQFETIQPNGKTSFTLDIQKSKIMEAKDVYDSISSLKKGGYLIFNRIWFFDSRQNKHEVECNIAWMIE